MCVSMSRYMCGGQRTACMSYFSLSVHRESQGWNSDLQAQQQVQLPAESSLGP